MKSLLVSLTKLSFSCCLSRSLGYDPRISPSTQMMDEQRWKCYSHAVRTDFPTWMFSEISSRYIVIVTPSLASENCLSLYFRALLPKPSLPLVAPIWKGCKRTQRTLNSKASQKDICSLPGRTQVASLKFIDKWNNENVLISPHWLVVILSQWLCSCGSLTVRFQLTPWRSQPFNPWIFIY